MDSIIIKTLIGTGRLTCPQCGHAITRCQRFTVKLDGEEFPHPRGFGATLVCGTCQGETQVNERDFATCIR